MLVGLAFSHRVCIVAVDSQDVQLCRSSSVRWVLGQKGCAGFCDGVRAHAESCSTKLISLRCVTHLTRVLAPTLTPQTAPQTPQTPQTANRIRQHLPRTPHDFPARTTCIRGPPSIPEDTTFRSLSHVALSDLPGRDCLVFQPPPSCNTTPIPSPPSNTSTNSPPGSQLPPLCSRAYIYRSTFNARVAVVLSVCQWLHRLDAAPVETCGRSKHVRPGDSVCELGRSASQPRSLPIQLVVFPFRLGWRASQSSLVARGCCSPFSPKPISSCDLFSAEKRMMCQILQQRADSSPLLEAASLRNARR
eukprot:663563-Rhodomonas_salina.2